MGTWGYGIFDDDTALDIRGDFQEYVEEGLSINKATERILEEYEEVIEDDDEDCSTVYLALASLQMEYGELEEKIKNMALDIIESGKGLEIWEEVGASELEKRKKILNDLKIKLLK